PKETPKDLMHAMAGRCVDTLILYLSSPSFSPPSSQLFSWPTCRRPLSFWLSFPAPPCCESACRRHGHVDRFEYRQIPPSRRAPHTTTCPTCCAFQFVSWPSTEVSQKNRSAMPFVTHARKDFAPDRKSHIIRQEKLPR